jgi:hypothetical protein
MPSYLPPGTPLYTEEGGEILNGPRKLNSQQIAGTGVRAEARSIR